MNCNILNLRHLTVLLILCTAFLGGAIPAFAQQGGKKMTGQVIDENKEPMIGVSILIVGTSTGTVTDFDGNYTLNVPKDSKELQFSYVGYETKVITIPVNSNVLNVQMKSDSQVLSDVVIIGYGTQRKSDLTGSVASVGTKDFNKGMVSSPEELVNGKIAGVQIVNGGGSPTSVSTIRIRGGASLNASNDPLIVLDGGSYGSGWFHIRRRKLSKPYKSERHREYDRAERCFIHCYLWITSIQRRHHHNNQKGKRE